MVKSDFSLAMSQCRMRAIQAQKAGPLLGYMPHMAAVQGMQDWCSKSSWLLLSLRRLHLLQHSHSDDAVHRMNTAFFH